MPMFNNKQLFFVYLFFLIIILCAGFILYSIPPTENSIYPPCIFHKITGLYCPGCGSTRAIHSLLHLEIRKAFAYNPLVVIFLPFISLWLLISIYRIKKGQSTIILPNGFALFFLILIVSFWVLRNIPIYPFNLLAPH